MIGGGAGGSKNRSVGQTRMMYKQQQEENGDSDKQKCQNISPNLEKFVKILIKRNKYFLKNLNLVILFP